MFLGTIFHDKNSYYLYRRRKIELYNPMCTRKQPRTGTLIIFTYTDYCFLIPVENPGLATLQAWIKEWILLGLMILSNCWKYYNCLSQEGNFQHFTVITLLRLLILSLEPTHRHVHRGHPVLWYPHQHRKKKKKKIILQQNPS